MTLWKMARHGWQALMASAVLVLSATAQTYPSQGQPDPNRQGGYIPPAQMRGQPRQPSGSQIQPAHRFADRSAEPASQPAAERLARQPDEHPLMPAIRWAREGLVRIRQIQDYSTILVKRERVGSKLTDQQYMFVKVRHNPMSVYMYFLKPKSLNGQEVIWIEGENDGKMWAHGTGLQKVFGTVSLAPTSPIAMKGNRYPITEIGILNMVERLVEVAEADAKYAECEVKFTPGAKINERTCTCIQVIHPVPRRNFLFHMARIFVDDELNLPIRYEAYEWPDKPGGPPQLIEEYTYLKLKLNNGFTDADFDIRNPQYQFKEAKKQEALEADSNDSRIRNPRSQVTKAR